MVRRLFSTSIAILICAFVIASPALGKGQTAQNDRSIPEGFEDLAEDRRDMVDVLYKGRPIGVFEIVQSPDTVLFINPDSLIDALPELTDDARRKLSMPLQRNQAKACPKGLVVDGCGHIEAEDVGIIHTTELFRVDLFIALTALKEHSEVEYLPAPEDKFNTLTALNFVASGTDDDSALRFSANASSIASLGAKRLVSDLEWTDEFGVRVREGFIAADLRTTRAYAGLFESRSLFTQRDVRVLGVGFKSQLDTLLNREKLIGSPLIIFLRDRGRVEVLFDGRLLIANTYPSGNVQLDTSNFPEGNYELEIRISDSSGPPRIERRLFTKDGTIPLPNRGLFFFESGIEQPRSFARDADQNGGGMLRAGVSFRVASALVAGAGFDVREARSEASGSFTYFNSYLTTRINGALSNDGARGLLSISSNASGPFAYGGIVRYERLDDNLSSGDLRQSILQGSGYGSWTSGIARVSIIGDYREVGGSADYSVSATGQIDIARSQSVQVSLVADGTLSSTGNGYFAGVRLNLFGSRNNVESVLGIRAPPDRTSSSSPWTRHAYGTSFDIAQQAQLNAQGFGEFEQGRETIGGAADIRATHFDAFADFTSTNDVGRNRKDFSFGAGSLVSFNGETVTAARKEAAQGLVRVAVKGSRIDDRFEVYVNDQLRGLVHGNKALTLQLPPYRQYAVRIKAIRSGPLAFAQNNKTIVLYPGNVVDALFEVTTVVPVLGRLMRKNETPLPHVSVSWKREIGQTDDDGYFQLETVSGAELNVMLADGHKTSIFLPTFDAASQFVNVGTIIVDPAMEDNQ